MVILPAIPLAVVVRAGYTAVGVVVFITSTTVLLGLGVFTPPRCLHRAERMATTAVPGDDRDVTLVGTIAAVDAPLVAPHSRRPCAAFWERSLRDSDSSLVARDESLGAVDFVLQCGELLVAVEATGAEVLFDPRRATFIRDLGDGERDEETAAGLGDRVVVSGYLTHGPADGPYRATPRITGKGRRRVIIGLVGGGHVEVVRTSWATAASDHEGPRDS